MSEYEAGLFQMRILWALKKGKRYGYEITKFLGGKHPNVYSALRKLESMGLVRSRREGRRRVYDLTRKGERELFRVVRSFLEIYQDIFEDYVCSVCEVKK